jgi:hypothetical protein
LSSNHKIEPLQMLQSPLHIYMSRLLVPVNGDWLLLFLEEKKVLLLLSYNSFASCRSVPVNGDSRGLSHHRRKAQPRRRSGRRHGWGAAQLYLRPRRPRIGTARRWSGSTNLASFVGNGEADLAIGLAQEQYGSTVRGKRKTVLSVGRRHLVLDVPEKRGERSMGREQNQIERVHLRLYRDVNVYYVQVAGFPAGPSCHTIRPNQLNKARLCIRVPPTKKNSD